MERRRGWLSWGVDVERSVWLEGGGSVSEGAGLGLGVVR